MKSRSIAIIGSFKQHNESVQRICAALRSAGITVTSPLGTQIVQEGIDFVRFATDPTDWADSAVQSLALHRIFAANLVYVVSPDGYVGKTTCYEIGRVLQRQQPIYFSALPVDLPVHIPPSFVLNEGELLDRLGDPSWTPSWLFEFDGAQTSAIERALIKDALRNE
ncbi:hypothetical protein [Methyloterricola oryzae]|uniref:hypothetical protein n=1 Tax=Methyloterricola oryzae TaxID=1495050 RepID=UPI0005EBC0CC|nr:hypothetical protein [Methyloterricola oryzae]